MWRNKKNSVHKLSARLAKSKRRAEAELANDGRRKRLRLTDSNTENKIAEEFQTIIRERAEEAKAKAEEKRKHDLKLIAEMILENEGNVSVKPSAKKEALILQILCIVRECPKQWTTIHSTSSCVKNGGKCYHRELARISAFRCVSKSFRDAIDKRYEESLLRAMHCYIWDNRNYKVPTLGINLWDNSSFKVDAEKMLSDFTKGPSSKRAKRLFFRSLEVDVSERFKYSEEDEQRFLHQESKITSFLKSIGDQVLKFTFRDNNGREKRRGLSKNYALLHKLIAFMPNLKWATIVYSGYYKKYYVPERPVDIPPFPFLPHLERVEFSYNDMECQQKMKILTSVLRANPHIKTLYFDGELEADNDDHRIIFRQLYERIKNIPLKLEKFSVGFAQMETILPEVMQPYVIANWKLKSLEFTYDENVVSTLVSAFNFINNFPTLENLTIYVDHLKVGGVIPTLQLPNLISFHLTAWSEEIDNTVPSNVAYFYSLQFLIQSKKLRSIFWKSASDLSSSHFRRFLVDHGHLEMIRFGGGHRDLRFSNIWKVFRELKHVIVNCGMEPGMEYRKSDVIQFYMDEHSVNDTGMQIIL